MSFTAGRAGHPDIAEAVDSPKRVTDGEDSALRMLDLLPSVPMKVWGRDELGAGEMWNSNPVIAWLLVRCGFDIEAIQPERAANHDQPLLRLGATAGGGGWLVNWGDNPLVTAFDRSGRTAFRLELAASTFRAVPVPEGATTVAALDRGLETMERGR